MSMKTLLVSEVLKDKVLVSRDSARLLKGVLSALVAGVNASASAAGSPSVAVDFEGVEGIAPSFLDELLSVFESCTSAAPGSVGRCLMIVHPPTRLSSKFQAIARGHGMSVRALDDGSWILADARSAAA